MRAAVAMGSPLEREFETHWKRLGGPALEREYVFAPPRKWRFDFAHPQTRVAVECEGGVFTRGRHTRGMGFVRDCEKTNTAARLGWLIHRIPGGKPFTSNPDEWIHPILATIRAREAPTAGGAQEQQGTGPGARQEQS